ncbi:hypothetical protein WA588_000697 [Blastocystis sp. NMH]
MDVETSLDSLDSDLKLVLMTGMEYTEPGSVISNCILLIGSAEGDCGKCTKPCLHPLATVDLESFFHNPDIIKIDWIDDTACIVICKDPATASSLFQEFFTKVFCEESGLEWYRSNERVVKMHDDDSYGEKGKSIHVFARICLSSDIERLQGLRKAKMINNMIKRRKELQSAKKKAKTKMSKKKRQRMRKRQMKQEENAMEQEVKNDSVS